MIYEPYNIIIMGYGSLATHSYNHTGTHTHIKVPGLVISF